MAFLFSQCKKRIETTTTSTSTTFTTHSPIFMFLTASVKTFSNKCSKYTNAKKLHKSSTAFRTSRTALPNEIRFPCAILTHTSHPQTPGSCQRLQAPCRWPVSARPAPPSAPRTVSPADPAHSDDGTVVLLYCCCARIVQRSGENLCMI